MKTLIGKVSAKNILYKYLKPITDLDCEDLIYSFVIFVPDYREKGAPFLENLMASIVYVHFRPLFYHFQFYLLSSSLGGFFLQIFQERIKANLRAKKLNLVDKRRDEGMPWGAGISLISEVILYCMCEIHPKLLKRDCDGVRVREGEKE